MAKRTLAEQSTDELESTLRSVKSLQRTVLGIFVVIIVAWIALGFWRQNTPVFISTIAVALAAIASTLASRRGVEAELEKRQGTR